MNMKIRTTLLNVERALITAAYNYLYTIKRLDIRQAKPVVFDIVKSIMPQDILFLSDEEADELVAQLIPNLHEILDANLGGC